MHTLISRSDVRMTSGSYHVYFTFLIGLVVFHCDVTDSSRCQLSAINAEVEACKDARGLDVLHYGAPDVGDGTSCDFTCVGQESSRTALCTSGGWSPSPCSSDAVEKPRHREKRFLGWFIGGIIIGGLFSGRSGGSSDQTPPTVSCPPDIHRYADPVQVNTRVSWDESVVTAVDNVDGTISAKRSSWKGPDFVFEGVTYIYYHASDNSGNSGSCKMTITVEVIRCSPGPNPSFRNGYYTCHPSSDFVYGTTCNYGCYYGYKISGLRRRDCDKSGLWSSVEPHCEVVTCPGPDPISDGTFECTDGFNFKSACSYTCRAGYDVKQGLSRVRVCAFNGRWRGDVPECTDSEPPTFIDCPRVLTYFAGKNSSKGLVSWAVPRASDNSGADILVSQTSGIENNAYHKSGVYEVVYDAVDAAGNKAKQCKFKVVVKELKCFAQYPLPYMSVSCPNGYKYGALCDYSCESGYSLQGSSMTVCEMSSTDTPYAFWKINEQPSCSAMTGCPTLTPPDNGALACDLWLDGSFCQMQCMTGTDIGPDFHSWKLFVCLNSGLWDFDGYIPPCVATRQALVTRMTADLYYFDDACTDDATIQKIKENFLAAFRRSPFSPFIDDSGLALENVEVTCGAITIKRSISDKNQVNVHFEIVASLAEEEEPKTAFKAAEERSLEVLQAVKDDVKQDDSKLLGTPASSRSGVTVVNTPVEIDCPQGTLPSYRSMGCVGCSPGTYFSQTSSCEACPIGSYQPESGQFECVPCPEGKTTLKLKSQKPEDCLPMCSLGHFSSNGVEPCTPCDIAEYADQIGSLSCKKCPVSMTTVQQAATGSDSCKHFDIALITAESSKVELDTHSLNFDLQSGFRMKLWLSLTGGGDIVILTAMDTRLLTLRADENLHLIFATDWSSHLVDTSLERDRWYQVSITFHSSLLTIFVENVMVYQGTLSEPMWSTVSSLSVVVGDDGLQGSISQLNIWSSATEDTPPSQPSCFSEKVGDIVSWDMFISSNITEAFLQVPSLCDDTNECESSPCHSGQCFDLLHGYRCECDEGFQGDICDDNIDDCQGNLCINGATCVDGISAYTCLCTPDHTGQFCDANLVNGNWGQWGNWSSCSTTCGPGQRQRMRLCDNPLPQNGGTSCVGPQDETGVCNDDDCPVCSNLTSPGNGKMHCEEEVGMQRCGITCNDGFDFDREPLTEYKCGTKTGYTWSHITKDNPNGNLPNCMPIEQANVLQVDYTASYEDLPCSPMYKDQVGKQVADEIERMECIVDNSCYIKSIDINECDNNRKKRDIVLANFLITIASNPLNVGTQESLAALSDAISQLNSSASDGWFTINVGGSDYHLSSEPELVGHVTCPVGWADVNYYCVPCGPGTFYINGYCELCGIGRYNRKSAVSSCAPCPEGTSTPGKGSLGPGECTVDISSGVPLQIILYAVLIPVTVLALGVVVFLYCKSPKWKKTARRVHNVPEAWGPGSIKREGSVYDMKKTVKY